MLTEVIAFTKEQEREAGEFLKNLSPDIDFDRKPLPYFRLKDRCLHDIRKNACSRCGGVKVVARQLFKRAKQRATKNKINFEITHQDVYDKVVATKGFCPVLGMQLIMGGGRKEGRGVDAAPTLDRIVNTEGYIKENIFVISYRANSLKSNATSQELRLIARYVTDIERARGQNE